MSISPKIANEISQFQNPFSLVGCAKKYRVQMSGKWRRQAVNLFLPFFLEAKKSWRKKEERVRRK